MYHGHDLMAGFRSCRKRIRKLLHQNRRQKRTNCPKTFISNSCRHVPSFTNSNTYFIVLIISILTSALGVAIDPFSTSHVGGIFETIMVLIMVITCGLIQGWVIPSETSFILHRITSMQVPLNIAAEFIGGALIEGNANVLIYSKDYDYWVGGDYLVRAVGTPPKQAFIQID